MQLGKQVRRIKPDRQARLRAYLALYGIAVSDVARHMGLTKSTASKILAGDSAPSHRVEQLVELGIPRRLLPAPEDKKRGPKPRGDQAA